MKNYVERKVTNVEKNIFCFFLSNGMFLNLSVSWLEYLRNSSIFVIYNLLGSFELKIKLSVLIMSLMVSDETGKVIIYL